MFFLGYFYFGHIFFSNEKIYISNFDIKYSNDKTPILDTMSLTESYEITLLKDYPKTINDIALHEIITSAYFEKKAFINKILQEEKLFNAIDELYPHIKPIIICALQTGMRKSEIFNLQWANINYDYNYIELLETKSGKARKIPISDKLNKVFSKQSKNYNYVFTNLDTGLPYRDIHKSFNAVLKKANIKNFRFHDLRHTVATRLVEQGVPLPVVQEILGHSKIETTMRYAHAIPEQKINAINLLSNYC